MKQEEEADQKNEPKLEYSYQLKDDKKETSTPLIEFLSAKNQEKRDVKVKEEILITVVCKFYFIFFSGKSLKIGESNVMMKRRIRRFRSLKMFRHPSRK